MSETHITYPIEELLKRNVLFIGDGYRAKNEELGTDGLPFARGANINNGFLFDDADCFPLENIHRVGNKVSQPGDVVFTSKGTVGRFAYVDATVKRFVYSPQLCFWRVLNTNEIDSRFLFYWIQGREFFLQYNGVKGQTDMADYVSLGDQRRMYITLPSIEEQRAIAQILGSLDDKIEANRRMNATLEATARAIFKSWFVDFDPVHCKSRGEQPPGMDVETAALFPDRFEDSELGLIPAGWGVSTLGNEIELAYGKPLKADTRLEGDIPVYGSNGQVGWHNEAIVQGPGIVVGRKGNPGTVTWIPDDFFPIDTTFYVVPLNPNMPLEFLFFTLELQDLPSLSADSAVPGLNRNIAYMNTVVVPDERVTNCFAEMVKPIIQQVARNNEESRTLAETRDVLLPKLVSGKVRVGE